MSTITKISSSREETDSYASEERKLEMRRRLHLQSRGKASLSLSSLEELSHQQSTRANSKNMRFRSGACLPDPDDKIAEKKLLIDESTDFIDGHLLGKIPRLSDLKEGDSGGSNPEKETRFVFDGLENELKKFHQKQSSNLNVSRVQDKILTAPQAVDERFEQRSCEEDKTGKTREDNSILSYGLTKNIEDVLDRVQALAVDTGGWEHEKAKAVSNLFSHDSGLTYSKDDMTKAKGDIRFLNAFIGGVSLEHPYRNELLASLAKINQIEKTLRGPQELETLFEQSNPEEKQAIQSADDDERLKNKPSESAKKDLDTIYLYLETITAASAAPTLPIMLERFSKFLKSRPDQAIQRLAVSGAGIDTIELVAREAERRLNTLTEKMETVTKKSTQSTNFKTAIMDEREKLRSALLSFEKISNHYTARQIAEKEQEKLHAETTLLAQIAKSC